MQVNQMRFIYQKREENTNTAILLLHGSTQLPFNYQHPLTTFFSAYSADIISVELPGHGKSPFKERTSVEELLKMFFDEITQLKEKYKNVGFVGYSLGGGLALKATEAEIIPTLFVVTFGTGFKIEPEEFELIKMFFSNEFFEQLGWLERMRNVHSNWDALIESIPQWYEPGTSLLPNIDILDKRDIPILIILGENDEPFPPKKNLPLLGGKKNLESLVVNEINHFGYFEPCIWKNLSNVIEQFIARHNLLTKKK